MQASKPFADSCVIDPTNPNTTATRLSRSVCSRWLSALLSLLLLATAPVLAQSPPVFDATSYAFEYAGEQTVGAVLGTVSASDVDGDAVTYTLTVGDSGRFSVGLTSGVVSYTGSGGEDVTRTPSYGLTITATAGGQAVTASVQVSFGICARTEAVRNALVGSGPGFSSCLDGTVTRLNDKIYMDLSSQGLPALQSFDFAALGSLRFLYLNDNQLSSLPADVFAGLGSLQYFSLSSNQLSSLPAEVFAGLGSLQELNLINNPGAPFAVELTVEQSGSSAFRVRSGLPGVPVAVDWVATGAASGSESGTAEIGAGAIRSAAITLSASDHTTVTLSNPRITDSSNFPGFTPSVAAALVLGTPQFSETRYAFQLEENRDGSASAIPIGSVAALDPNGDSVSYSLSGGATGLFSVGVMDGVVSYIGMGEDLESTSAYTLEVKAVDSSLIALSVTVEVVVSVTGNRAPEFEAASYAFAVIGSGIAGTVRATDADNDPVSYSLASGSTAFSVGTSSGVVSYSGRTVAANVSYTLVVSARDGEGASASAMVTVLVRALGFEAASYAFKYAGEQTVGAVLGTVLASDVDGDAVAYAITAGDSGRFSVGPTSGVVSYIGSGGEDVVLTPGYGLTITATADGQTASAAVQVGFGICARTEAVRNAIVGNISGVSDCVDVTVTRLNFITSLSLNSQGLTALQSFDFAGLGSLQYLSLHSNQLSSLLADVFAGLGSLQQLYLNHNQLSSLPADVFAGLDSLQDLRLNSNQLSSVPADVFAGLGSLGRLYLFSNKLSSLPADVFAGLGSLQDLVLRNNLLSSLPADVFAGLGSLEVLQLDDNLLSSLPADVFAGLSSLQSLPLSNNQLSSLPADVFAALGSLQYLWLDDNQLSSLPADVFAAPGSLQYLFLHNNQLSSLPADVFAGLGSLQYLYLSDNPGVPFAVELTVELSGRSAFRVRSGLPGAPVAVDWVATGAATGSESGTAGISVGATRSAAITLSASDHTTVTLSNPRITDTSNFEGFAPSVAAALVFHAPQFSETRYAFTLEENRDGSASAIPIGSVAALDPNGDSVSYSLSGGATELFSVGVTDGAVSYIGTGEDFESTSAYTLEVRAVDSSSSALSAKVTVLVLVRETAVANTTPTFETASYGFTVSDSGPVGTVRATDADNDTVSYSLLSGGSDVFSVGTSSGVVLYSGGTVATAVSYTLLMSASAGGASDSATVTVLVGATAVAMNTAPGFEQASYGFTVSDSGPVGTVTATDADNDAVSYSLLSGGSDVFSVGTSSGVVLYSGGTVATAVSYTLLMSASAGGASDSATVEVVVSATAVAMNTAPGFEQASYGFTVSDSGPVGTVRATDADNDAVSYSLLSGGSDVFSVGTSSGVVLYSGGTVATAVSYTLLMSASAGGASDSATVTVLVGATAVAMNTAPGFEQASYGFTVSDSGPVGTVTATDADNDAVSYSLLSGGSDVFSVGTSSGVVLYSGGTVATAVSYTLLMSASAGGASDSATVEVVVSATAVAMNTAPGFEQASYGFTVSDSGPVGTVRATDADNDAVSYSLLSGGSDVFSVGTSSGVVLYSGGTVATAVSYTLLMSASAGGASDSATVEVVVSATAVAMNTAPGFEQASYGFTVSDSGPVGTVTATDADNDTVSYSLLSGGSDVFSVGTSSGVVLYSGGTVATAVSYTLLMSASAGGASDSATVTVLVGATAVAMNTAPGFEQASYGFTVSDSGPVGTVTATDADNDAVSYSLLSGGSDVFSVGTSSGVVLYSGGTVATAVSYTLLMSASAGGASDSATVEVVVSATAVAMNTAPGFEQASYGFTVSDSGPVGTVRATDADNDTVSYSLLSGGSDVFSVGTSSGVVLYSGGTVATAVSYTLLMSASAGGASDSATVEVVVSATAVAMNTAPGFEQASYGFTVSDSGPVGTVRATDADNDTVSYSLLSGGSDVFSVGTSSGVVLYSGGTVATAVSYTLLMSASAGGASDSATVEVVVSATAVAMNTAPGFEQASYGFTVSDSGPVGTVTAMDADNDTVSYSLLSGGSDVFSVGTSSGVVLYSGGTVATAVSYTLLMSASAGGASDSATVEVVVSATAVAMNTAPGFEQASYGFTVSDSGPVGTVRATDADNDTVSYSLLSGGSDVFSVGTSSGVVLYSGGTVATAVSYTLLMSASAGGASDSATVEVVVSATAVAMNTAPGFEQASYGFTVSDSGPVGTVRATDADNDTVSYSLLSGGSDVFSVGTSSGVVLYSGGTVATAVSYTLLMSASAGGASDSATVEVVVSATAVAMNTAPGFEQASYGFTVSDSGPVGTVRATDADNDTVSYSLLSGGSDVFSVGTSSGVVLYSGGTVATAVSYTLLMSASAGGASDSATVTVLVGATAVAMNTAPGFEQASYGFTVSDSGPVGTVTATDADNDTVSYSLLSGGSDVFSVGTSSGVVLYSGGTVATAVSYTLLMSASAGGASDSATVEVVVSATAVAMNTAPGFEQASYGFTVSDSGPVGTVRATDADNDAVSYSLLSGGSDVFSVGTSSGVVLYSGGTVATAVSYTLLMSASAGGASDSATVEVVVSATAVAMNTAPGFEQASYGFTVSDSGPVGTVRATDADNDTVSYSLLSGGSDVFSVGTSSGVVLYSGGTVATAVSYTLLMSASAGGASDSATVEVVVSATAVAMNTAPGFEQASYGFTVSDSGPVGTVRATDADNDAVSYSLLSGGSDVFSVGTSSGVVLYSGGTVATAVSYTLLMSASAGGASDSATVEVVVSATAVAMNTAPGFEQASYGFTVSDSGPVGTVRATDADNDTVSYSLLSGGSDVFSVGTSSGVVLYSGGTVATAVSYTLLMSASAGGASDSATVEVVVSATAVAMNTAPGFEQASYGFTVSDSGPVGTVRATDADNDAVSYSLLSGGSDVFSVGTSSGVVLYSGGTVATAVSYTLLMSASAGGASDSATVEVVVSATAVAMNTAPGFEQASYGFTVSDSGPVGTVTATDADNDTVSYSLLSGGSDVFSVGTSSGVVLYSGGTVATAVSYTLLMSASAGGASDSATVEVVVSATAVAMNTAPGFEQASYGFTVSDSGPVGTVRATDADNDTVSYSLLSGGSDVFSVGTSSGVVLYSGGTVATAVSYTLLMSASAGGASDSATVEVVVSATAVAMNTAPGFEQASYGFTVSDSGPVGTVTAMDADNDTVSYSLLSGGSDVFSVGTSSGVVLYSGGTVATAVSYTLLMSASAGGASDSATVEVVVSATAVAMNTAPGFEQASYGFTVSDSGPVGTVRATDADNDTVSYSLLSGGSDVFSVGTSSGVVLYSGGTVATAVSYTLLMSASAGGASDSATVEVVVSATAVAMNTAPGFEQASYGFTVSDSGPVGTVRATDADNDTVSYSLLSGGSDVFSVGTSSGVVLYSGGTVATAVSYTLLMSASAGGASDSATVEVVVSATAVAMNTAPGFEQASYGFTVSDSGPVGTVRATDADNDTVSYSLLSGGSDVFSVGTSSGVVLYSGGTVATAVSYTLLMSASAGGASDSATVTVLVGATAVAMNTAPGFEQASYGFTVSDSGPVGTVTATDADNDTVSYSLLSGGSDVFSVGTSSGVVLYSGGTVATAVSYTLLMSASAGGASDSATVEVVVSATAVAMNTAPGFEQASYGFTVSDSGPVGTVTATDADNDAVSYSLLSGGSDVFSVGTSSGVVLYSGGTVATAVSYTLLMSASAGGASDSATVEVVVSATAVAMNTAPGFEQASYGFTVSDSGPVGTVRATDADNDTVSYSLLSGGSDVFSVGTSSGVVLYSGGTVATAVSYTLLMSASAGGASDSATVEVVVSATAVAMNTAPGFEQASYGFTVSDSGPVGTVRATDADNDAVSYSLLSGGSDVFSVGTSSGVVLYSGGTVATAVSYTLLMSASAGGASDSATVEVVVSATAVAMNTAPGFEQASYGFTVSDSGPVGTVTATDADNDTVSYSLLSGGSDVFSVGTSSGVVLYSGGTVATAVSYTLLMSASAGGASDSATVEVVVSATAVAMNTAPGFEQASYGFTVSDSGPVGTVTATDADNDAVSYSLLSGGSDVFSVGTLSGAVSYSGGTVSSTVSYTLAVSASDTSGASVTAMVEVVVRATAAVDNRAPSFEQASYAFTVSDSGIAGTVRATDADGDEVIYELASGSTAFSVEIASGAVSYSGGTVAADVSYTLVVSANDEGASDSATVTVLVRATAAVDNRAPSFEQASYVFTVSDSGTAGVVTATDANNETVSYSLASGSTAFSVGETSGVVSYSGGTVAVTMSYTLVVSASDVAGASDSATVEVVVSATAVANVAPSFDPPSYAFTIHDSETQVGTVVATDDGGAAALSYSLASGDSSAFSVGAANGVITYSGGAVDATVSYTLALRAVDAPGAYTVATVAVLVTEDQASVFDPSSYMFTLGASRTTGAVLGTVSASDSDGDNIAYALASGDGARFNVGQTSGLITYTRSGADDEDVSATPSYTLVVRAMSGRKTMQAQVVINVVSGICTRTAAVLGRILASTGVTDCIAVTAPQLSEIDTLSVINADSALTLQSADFAGLSSLVGLVLSGNRLSVLPGGVFAGLSTLLTLDLSNNSLSDVVAVSGLSAGTGLSLARLSQGLSGISTQQQASVFNALVNLQALNISGNLLTSLPADAFKYLSNLRTLDLSSNRVSMLDEGIFTALSSLVNLNISSNLLTALPPAVFSGLSNLQTLQAAGNAGDFTIVLEPEQVGVRSFRVRNLNPGIAVSVTWEASPAATVSPNSMSNVGIGTGATSSSTFGLSGGGALTATITLRNGNYDTAAFSGFTLSFAAEITLRAPPQFSGSSTFTLAENTSGSVIAIVLGTVTATDSDGATPADLTLEGATEMFSIDIASGKLSYVGSGEDAEATSSYTLTVRASDSRLATLFATTELVVDITNVAETPMFATAAYTFALAERQPGPRLIGAISALAGGETVSYVFTAGADDRFSVNAAGAVYYIGAGENFSMTGSYTLTARANGVLGLSELFDTTAVVVTITDVEGAPIFIPSSYRFTIGDTDAMVGSVTASDPDGLTVTYSLTLISGGGSGTFSVNAASGVILYSGVTVATVVVNYTLQATAYDSATSSVADVLVTVLPTAIMAERSRKTKAVLADVGRGIAISTLDVIGGRFDAAPHIKLSGNALKLSQMANGQWANGQWARQLTEQWAGNGQWARELTALRRWMNWDSWQRSGAWNGKEREVEDDFGMGERWDQVRAEWERIEAKWDTFRNRLVSGSSFLVPLGGGAGGAKGAAGTGAGGLGSGLSGWTIWGKGRVSGFERVSDGLRTKGESLSGYLGADYQVTKALMLGVAISRSKGDAYSERAQPAAGSSAKRIDIDTMMTTVWPYLNWRSGGVSFWGSIGRGSGSADINDRDIVGGKVTTDIDLSGVAFGVKHRLLTAGNTRVDVKADWFDVDIESDAVDGMLMATESGAHRLRVALATSSHWRHSKTSQSRGGVEFGLRADGGDSVKGRGVDMGAHLGYDNVALGLSLTSRARVLVAHSEDYREWGLEASVQLQPGMLQRGLSLTLTPRWGRAATDLNKLWSSGVTALQRNAGDNAGGRGLMPDQMQLLLSYAWGYGGMVLRPYTEFSMQRDTLSEVKLGLKLNAGSAQLSLFGSRARDFGVSSTFRW